MPFKDPEKKSQYKSDYYQKNKKRCNDRVRKLRRRNMDYIIQIKESNPCVDCSQFFPHCAMDFDHIDISSKTDMVSRLSRSFSLEKIQEEIDKCDLVCANCHRIRTFKRKQYMAY